MNQYGALKSIIVAKQCSFDIRIILQPRIKYYVSKPRIKMSLPNYVAFFVYLQLSLTIFGHKNSTGNDEVSERNISCNTVQFDELKLADVLHLMREPAVNIIKITVTVPFANRTRGLPEMKWPWANVIGRTIFSLISRIIAIFDLQLYTLPLEVGMETVSVEVREKLIGCLPSGKE